MSSNGHDVNEEKENRMQGRCDLESVQPGGRKKLMKRKRSHPNDAPSLLLSRQRKSRRRSTPTADNPGRLNTKT